MINLAEIRKQIESASEDARFEVFTALFVSEESGAAAEILRIARGADPILKIYLLRFLGGVPEERSITYIRDLLTDTNSIVAEAAKRAIEKNQCRTKLNLLVPLVNTTTGDLQIYIIRQISHGGLMELLAPLLQILPTANEGLCLEILSAMRYLPDDRSLPALEPFLADAVAVNQPHSGGEGGRAPSSDGAPGRMTGRAPLIDGREEVRFRAIMVVGAIFELGNPTAKQYLLHATKDDVPRIRQAALWILSRRPSKGTVDLLCNMSKKDPDQAVRQEALKGLLPFPTRGVILHLVQIITGDHDKFPRASAWEFTQRARRARGGTRPVIRRGARSDDRASPCNRLVRLKAEAVLLSMPRHDVVKGLYPLLRHASKNVRDRAFLLLAEMDRGSKSFYRHLTEGLERAAQDKDRLPLIEALGVLEDPDAIPVLEKYLEINQPHSGGEGGAQQALPVGGATRAPVINSQIISYAALTSILKLWHKIPNPPASRYLADERLPALLKQAVLNHLIRRGDKKLLDDEVVSTCEQLLGDQNVNIRYLSMQVLAIAERTTVLEPLADLVFAETDPASQKLLESYLLKLLVVDPEQYLHIMTKRRTNPTVTNRLLKLLSMAEISEVQCKDILPTLFQHPMSLLASPNAVACADVILSWIMQQRTDLKAVSEALVPGTPGRDTFPVLLVGQLGNYPADQLKLQADVVEEWLKDPSFPRKAVIELLSYCEGPSPVGILARIVSDEGMKEHYSAASDAMKRLMARTL